LYKEVNFNMVYFEALAVVHPLKRLWMKSSQNIEVNIKQQNNAKEKTWVIHTSYQNRRFVRHANVRNATQRHAKTIPVHSKGIVDH
jgi:hypothetical protein